MEKTIHITIAKTLFQLEERAYEKLSAYLASLASHFRGEEDREEIIRDIESRIAEKLLERKHRLVTEDDVDAVIAEIGAASEFETESADAGPAAKAPGMKKLYRDTDNAVIAGVASGIAAYFNIAPLIVRSLFAISVFFGGSGILIYLLLWLLIPEAASASQKLEMRGDRVTLEGISRVVKERLSEAKERGALQKIIYFPAEVVMALLRFLRHKAFPLVGKILGALFTALSFFAILALTALLSVIVANWDKPYLDPSIREAISENLLAFSVGAGYVVLLIPLLFILLLGFRMVRSRSAIGSSVGFGLVGIWCLAVIASGAAATRIAGDYYAYTSTHPDYQEASRELEAGAFEKVDVSDARVTLRRGDTQSVVLEGKLGDLGRINAEVRDGTLFVSRQEATSTCMLFCRRALPSVVVTSPDIAAMEIEGGSVFFDEFVGKGMDVKMRYGNLAGKVTADALSLALESSNVRAHIVTEKLVLDSANAHIDLRGAATEATLSLRRSSLSGARFGIWSAEIRAEDSYAEFGEIVHLRLQEDQSRVLYKGEPEVEEI